MFSRKETFLESIRIPTWIKKLQQEDFEQKTSNGNTVSYLLNSHHQLFSGTFGMNPKMLVLTRTPRRFLSVSVATSWSKKKWFKMLVTQTMGKPMEKHKKCDIKVPLNIGCVPFPIVSKRQIDISWCLQFLDAKNRLKYSPPAPHRDRQSHAWWIVAWVSRPWASVSPRIHIVGWFMMGLFKAQFFQRSCDLHLDHLREWKGHVEEAGCWWWICYASWSFLGSRSKSLMPKI